MIQPQSPKHPRLLASRLGANWQEIKPQANSSEACQQLLCDIALSPNLIVLCGLGSSLYVNVSGRRLAPTMGDLWSDVSADPDFPDTREKVHFSTNDENIERFLSQCQLSMALQPDDNTRKFIQRAERMIVNRCRFVTSNVDLARHEMFLRKIARRSTRLPRLKLFTTNYDLAFEAAASRIGFITVDGFSHTLPSTFDGSNFNFDFVRRADEREGPEYIPNVFHLYKIHGSVDWELKNERVIRVEDPEIPLIIYPRNSKFESSYNPPFLEMMSRLQIALRQPNTGLLIIGFGFNDQHISQPILAAIRSNVGLKAAFVSPLISKEAQTNRHLSTIEQLILAGDDRLNLLEMSFEEMVSQLPDLVAKTEEEDHFRRLSEATRRI
jgi:hypothetical protein